MNGALARRLELSDFLRTRRAKLMPSDVGLADGARRRTPGLRREEVALLANIGTTWYTRLEQGLPINVSADVLQAISRALRLTIEERRHLFLLAGMPLTVTPDEDERVSELTQRVLEALNPNPAYVLGRRWDVLAWNCSADALNRYSEAEGFGRNALWRIFLCPKTLKRMGDPGCSRQRAVAQFRAVVAKYPHDQAIAELIDELRTRSAEFRTCWAEHDVLGPADGLKHYIHPDLGDLILDHTSFNLPGDRDMRMMVLTAAPGSETETKLPLLTTTRPASQAADTRAYAQRGTS
jgi:hypothetical protein